MDFFIWDDKYSIGIDDLDLQHKKLFGLLNDLYVHVYNGFNKEYHQKVLKEVVDYTLYHFDFEEKIINEKVPHLFESHKNEHELFKMKIEQYISNMDIDDSLSLLDLAELIKTWLLKHILISDQKIVIKE